MVQPVKFLPSKHKDLSLTSRTHIENEPWWPMPATQTWQSLRVPWLPKLAYLASFRSGEILQKKKKKVR